MPTVHPRLTICIPSHRHELLKRLAALQGSSMAKVVTETMETVYPVLERVCVVLEAAQRAQDSRKEGLRKAVAKAEQELAPTLYEVISQFDLFMDDAAQSVGLESQGSAMEQVRQIMRGDNPPLTDSGAAGGGEGGVNPRICNTGVRYPKTDKFSPQSSASKSGKRAKS
jgi:hypothetical protein